MSDYIDREKFIKLLVNRDLREISTKTIGECLDKAKVADVVEVVRCKDCKYGEVNRKSPIYGMWCERFGAEKSNLAVLPTDYCSYGEREEQEHE